MKTSGEIQNIKLNRKALAINNEWFNSFSEIKLEFNKGDSVEIEYTVKGDFKNIKSLKKLNNEPLPVNLKEVPKETINTILMTSRDLYLDSKNKDSLEEVTKRVLKSYKFIIDNIN